MKDVHIAVVLVIRIVRANINRLEFILYDDDFHLAADVLNSYEILFYY